MRIKEISILLERSRKFMDAAEYHYSKGDYDLAIFNMEQSLQLFLKAKLLECGLEFPKTHTLRKLFLLLGEYLELKDEFEQFVRKRSIEFSSLEDAYITARYFPREFERDEAERLKDFAVEVEEFVRKAIGKRG